MTPSPTIPPTTPAVSRPDLACPVELPIAAFAERITTAIKASPVVIVAGEPGSGKTTQLPKLCLAAGRGRRKKIGCTQPRRIAAISMAARLAEELGPTGAELVGYRIRFADRTGRQTRIKFMTDGILLAEAQRDRKLSNYDTIIVDEAHERSLNIDFLLGILKDLLTHRPDLKLIITSATIDTKKFSRHFNDAPVIQVTGRGHPVEIRYRPPLTPDDDDAATDSKKEVSGEEESYIEQATAAVMELVQQEPPGDILVFMPTERDIRESTELLTAALAGPSAGPKRPKKSGGQTGQRGQAGQMGQTGSTGVAGRASDAVIMPLYGRLSPREQRQIFRPVKGRKIVIATNVAETSITVPGIRYVVDTGLARIASYNPRARTYKLPVVPVARSACDQRAGRCGRVAPGVCVRLYAEEDYLNRPLYTPPEIVRSNLAEVILRMTSLQLGDPAAFPFVDPPAARAIRDGYQLLAELGALGEPGRMPAENEPLPGFAAPTPVPQPKTLSGSSAGQSGPPPLSRRGWLMSRLPLDPCISRMIIEARDNQALREVTIIAAALSIQDPRIRPTDREKEADRVHHRFSDRRSDFLFYLNLWDTMQAVLAQTGSKGRLRKFAQSHFLSFQRLREWQDIHEQLQQILRGEKGFTPNHEAADYAAMHRCLLSGNLRNIARKKSKNLYQAGGGREVMIFPGSGLYHRGGEAPGPDKPDNSGKKDDKDGQAAGELKKAATAKEGPTPPWLMAAELVETGRLYARSVAAIEPEWIEPLAGPLMRYSYSDPHWEKRRGQVVTMEKGTIFGLVVVAGRKVPLARLDPAEARRIFIESALVEGELAGDYHFLNHNRELLERLQDLEERSRRRDLLVGDEALAEFYHQRLPESVCDQAGLNRLLKKHHGKGGDDFLRMREEDLLSRTPEADLLAQFPAELAVGESRLALSYHFQPGADDDGLSVMVPVQLAEHLRPERFEWLVPGMLREKIFFLLKNLPKHLRRQLVPIPQTADELARTLEPGNHSLYQGLARAIYEMFGLRIEAAAWPVRELPAHLRCRFCLVDERSKILAAGRDLRALSGPGDRPDSLPAEALEKLRRSWEQSNISGHQLPAIAHRLPVTTHGGQLAGYLFPGLQEEGKQVALKLFTDPQSAIEASRRGLVALYRREFAARLKTLRQDLVFPRRQWRLVQGQEDQSDLNELNRAILAFVERQIFAVDDEPLPTGQEFQQRVAELRRDGFYQEASRLYELVLAVLAARWEVLGAIRRLNEPVAAVKTADRARNGGKKGQGGHSGLQGLASLVAAKEQAPGMDQAGKFPLAGELQRELAALVPPDFLDRYDATALARLPRYLQALRIRAERARTDPAKDAAKSAQLAPFVQRLAKYPDSATLSPRKRELLADYRLMLAEFRVSLFAQELKTSFPVSAKRLEEKWLEVEEVL